MKRFVIILTAAIALVAWAEKKKPDQQQPQQQQQTGGNNPQQQQPSQQQQQPPQQPQAQPLFGGQLNLKSSHQSKDSATLGMNGIGPNGEVDEARLKESPTSEDYSKAQGVSFYGVDHSELQTFIKEGNLKEKGGK